MARKFRCPACRTRRVSFPLLLRHCAETGHRTCCCGGYHHPHRPGSPCCHLNPMSPVYIAMRAGADEAELREIEMDIVFHTEGRPFTRWRD